MKYRLLRNLVLDGKQHDAGTDIELSDKKLGERLVEKGTAIETSQVVKDAEAEAQRIIDAAKAEAERIKQSAGGEVKTGVQSQQGPATGAQKKS